VQRVGHADLSEILEDAAQRPTNLEAYDLCARKGADRKVARGGSRGCPVVRKAMCGRPEYAEAHRVCAKDASIERHVLLASAGLLNDRSWPFCDMAWDANEGRFKSRSGHQRAGRAKPVYEFTPLA
jgi:hypothetical protein